MIVDVVLSPAEIDGLPSRDLSKVSCVVFDVLRATSSMITALAGGASEIWPVRTIEEARDLHASHPRALLGGERQGERIAGFSLGNSPFEYRSLPGETVISTTTNGTFALRACEGARKVFVGALLNLNALAARLRDENPEFLLLVCAGTFREFALEDGFAAGRFIHALGAPVCLSDAAEAMASISERYPDAHAALRQSRNGRALTEKGRGREVEWCARESEFKIVGEMRHGVIRSTKSATAEKPQDTLL